MTVDAADGSDGLICAFGVDAQGQARPLSWADLEHMPPDHVGDPTKGWVWLHFDRTHPRPAEWLRSQSAVDEHIVETLFATESRPRCSPGPDGTLLILRGVNLNPQADPEDLITVRCWIEANRIITLRRHRLMAIDAIRKSFELGQGPDSPGDLIVDLAAGLIDRMSPVIADFDDEIGDLEELQDDGDTREIRDRLVRARQKLIPLRRYLAPQRDALGQLCVARVDWLDDWQRSRLREVIDRVTRYVEDLDSARDRTSVIQDQITNRVSQRMNEVMMLLSVVSAIFLPITFITGLLGINVGGIPGAQDAHAFWLVTALLIALGVSLAAWFRSRDWF